MPRAEAGTPKAIANAMKSKGLQRLRWYCQVCQKQCRDENGFKCHAQSESHLRQMLVVGEHAGRQIADFSAQFQSEFVKLLSRRFGTKRVFANRVYQEYIQDKHHLHMNSTRWVTLTEFVKHLGRSGVARVDENEKGLFIAWIDNSPKALAKAEAAARKERATTSDEQRERLLIAEQIERANVEAEAEASSTPALLPPPEEDAPIRNDSAETKVVLSMSIKTPTPTTPAARVNPLKASTNPLKRPNPLKAASSSATNGEASDKKRTVPLSAAERLIIEEQGRKRRRMEREGAAIAV